MNSTLVNDSLVTKIKHAASELLKISIYLEKQKSVETLARASSSQVITSYDKKCWRKLGRTLSVANLDWISVVAHDISFALYGLIGIQPLLQDHGYKLKDSADRIESIKSWCVDRPLSFLFSMPSQIRALDLPPEINVLGFDTRMQAVSAALYERMTVINGSGMPHYDELLNNLPPEYYYNGDSRSLLVYTIEDVRHNVGDWFWFDEGKAMSRAIELDEIKSLPSGRILNVLTGEEKQGNTLTVS
ncbi:hypothetical protein V6259_13095 [Marinomonas sp. TI.3.20]|uniref:hypothetical protein n=1 Tax=Marinomonas sp. TI.3.20 TaxID=3121296 RepID=UPI00311E5E66